MRCKFPVFIPSLILLLINGVQATPRVAVSIQPVHSLVSSVMDTVGQPVLLIPGKTSPHIFRVTPSQARTIEQAELIIWVGPGLESKLARSLATLAQPDQLLTLSIDSSLRTYPRRQAGIWTADEHDHAHGHAIDPHIWLHPENAIKMLNLICQRLAAIDPLRSDIYQQNTAKAIKQINQLDKKLKQQLLKSQGQTYLVLHDTLQYFEKHYQLNPTGAMTINPERSPGAKRLRALRQLVVDNKVHCVFSEPQFGSQLIEVLTENTAATIVTIDPLGSNIPPGPGAYIATLQALGNNIAGCLQSHPKNVSQ